MPPSPGGVGRTGRARNSRSRASTSAGPVPPAAGSRPPPLARHRDQTALGEHRDDRDVGPGAAQQPTQAAGGDQVRARVDEDRVVRASNSDATTAGAERTVWDNNDNAGSTDSGCGSTVSSSKSNRLSSALDGRLPEVWRSRGTADKCPITGQLLLQR